MRKIYKIIVSGLFICLFLTSNNKSIAQKDILYFLREAPQVMQYNPAITPCSNFYLSLMLGVTDIGVHTSGFSYHDLIHKHPIYSDSLQLDLEGFRTQLSDNNFINFNYDMDLLGFGFKIGKNYFSYDLSLTLDSRVNFSKGIFDLILEGNNANNGNIRLLDGRLLDVNSYITNAIGYTREINDRLSIGGKIKLLSGIVNIHTNEANLELNFKDSEKISAHGELDILTANIIGDLSITSLFKENASADFIVPENLNTILDHAMDNVGLSFDLGASYRLLENLELSASVVDVFNFISWNTHTTQIINNKPFEEIVFEGITSSIDSIETNFETQINSLADSISSALDVRTQNISSYTTHLPMKIYFGATYNFGKVNYLHALFNTKIGAGRIYDTHISLFYSLHTRLLSLSFGNMFRSTNLFNPSALISLKLGKGQIYVGGNLHTNKDFNVADYNGFDIFMGINTTIGKSNYWSQHKWTEHSKKQEPIILENPVQIHETPQPIEQTIEPTQQPLPQTQPSNPEEMR
ncbi:MAG: DUF5723 family protein [Bacteroidales bacterium]|nr:DUF5723 family protein [Bacteroidales bacterium]